MEFGSAGKERQAGIVFQALAVIGHQAPQQIIGRTGVPRGEGGQDAVVLCHIGRMAQKLQGGITEKLPLGIGIPFAFSAVQQHGKHRDQTSLGLGERGKDLLTGMGISGQGSQFLGQPVRGIHFRRMNCLELPTGLAV